MCRRLWFLKHVMWVNQKLLLAAQLDWKQAHTWRRLLHWHMSSKKGMCRLERLAAQKHNTFTGITRAVRRKESSFFMSVSNTNHLCFNDDESSAEWFKKSSISVVN